MPDQLDLFDQIKDHPPPETLLDLWTPDDIFASLTQDLIARLHEDHRLDHKSARKEPRHLADDVCAFANTPPHGGVIVVGVEDDGSVSGFAKISTSQANRFEQLNDYCSDARLDTKKVPVTNKDGVSDFVLAIRVHFRLNRLVETTGGDAFVRRGDQKRRLSAEEKREVRIARGEIEYETEAIPLAYPEEFDATLLDSFANSYIQVRKLTGGHSREDVLALNHLGTIERGEFKPNLACGLLFARDPRKLCSGARVRFQRFEGITEGSGATYNLTRDDFIDGPLPHIIRDAEEIISRQMRNFTRLGKNGRFFTKPEYPKDAWIEAIVNALVHRSYNFKNMVVFVKMFDDRFTVESPGGFLPPVTADNLYDFHNPRNPFLMEALFYFGFVKCAHEGTRRMKEAMEDVGLPKPEFSQKEVGHFQVHVTLRNNFEARKTFVDADAAKIIGERIFSLLSGKEKMVINYIAEHDSINVSDANRILQCDWRTAKNLLDRMVLAGLLERVTATGKVRDPKARYVINVQPSPVLSPGTGQVAIGSLPGDRPTLRVRRRREPLRR